ncbi:MAG: cytochrome D ubiquinol oxidase subunit I [Chloroflexi bacterium RBG_19FT_COMBO_50_10]|nr:MAG: cytochrome D ubiquinol oxidase subunit I [Chloroflexi bacterium RBG_16_47_49]OGO64700.1 MAG: cytochrome D ubiquinol oxidase subunit I [Chloroflexi bacterium RBG_19FT_COMBO_50_10]
MDVLLLARLQFAITIIYHFFFVPLTLGLSIVVAIFETIYVTSGNEVYKRMTKFWGKLFLINFAIGVVTGIVQEFQFGMAWSEYSRYVGDIFGAPLAIEALVAFFVESTFLGVWVFGWDKLSKGLHAAVMWLVALSSTVSAMWILIANAFMQHPVGYQINNGRAELTDFSQVIFNRVFTTHFPHVISAGLTTAAFFVLGISAYHLVRKNEPDFFRKSFRIAIVVGLIGTVLVGIMGHLQGQLMLEIQPTKLAAMEAVRHNEDPAGLSLLTIQSRDGKTDIVDIRIPYLLSIMLYNRPSGGVQGMNELQAEYEQKYGPGDYIPSVLLAYLSFRAMVGIGLLLIAVTLLAIYVDVKNLFVKFAWFLKLLPWMIILPYLANTTGWILTETGREPWIVYGLLTMEAGVSKAVTSGMLLTSLIGFILVYGLLVVATLYLMFKFAKAGPEPNEVIQVVEELTPSLVNTVESE